MNSMEFFFENYSLTTTFLSFFALLFCVREAWQVFSWVGEHLGFENARTRRRKEAQDLMAQQEEAINKLQKTVEAMQVDLKGVKKENDMRRIKEIRREILEFSKTLKVNPPTREDCESIFEDHDEYTYLLTRWDKHNGIVSRAMEEIEEYYHTL